MRRTICCIFSLSTLLLSSCAPDSAEPPTLVYGAAELARCDESPDLVGDVYVMHGCGFLNQFYKVSEHGAAMTGTLCDSAGTCVYGVTARCGPFIGVDDGHVSGIVDVRTGEIATHDRFHGGQDDSMPLRLVLPLDSTGVETSAP
jgi:hypothetical protein